jgi:hypothetical protein
MRTTVSGADRAGRGGRTYSQAFAGFCAPESGSICGAVSGILAISLLACACATSGKKGPGAEWTVQKPKIERDGERYVLSVVSEACNPNRKLACNTALNRARALLTIEIRSLLDQSGSSGQGSRVEDTEIWLQRAVRNAQPAEVWTNEVDDCSWLLARVDLTAMTVDADAPVEAGRALENHLRSIAPPAASPVSGATCD